MLVSGSGNGQVSLCRRSTGGAPAITRLHPVTTQVEARSAHGAVRCVNAARGHGPQLVEETDGVGGGGGRWGYAA